jgi:zinc and cadmium transporter
MTDMIILFIVPFVGGLAALSFRMGKAQLKLILSFSGAYILGLSFFHILPSSYEGLGRMTGVWVVAGFLVQMLLELLSRGLEHGHVHLHRHHDHDKQPMPWSIFLGLSLHEFLEGMPFGHSHDHGEELGRLLIGVLIHKLPVAFVLTGMLLSIGFDRLRAVTVLSLFCLMSPLGGLFSQLLEGAIPEQHAVFAVVMALIVGMFMHIATTIIYETDEGHKFNAAKMAAILAAFALSFFSV